MPRPRSRASAGPRRGPRSRSAGSAGARRSRARSSPRRGGAAASGPSWSSQARTRLVTDRSSARRSRHPSGRRVGAPILRSTRDRGPGRGPMIRRDVPRPPALLARRRPAGADAGLAARVAGWPARWLFTAWIVYAARHLRRRSGSRGRCGSCSRSSCSPTSRRSWPDRSGWRGVFRGRRRQRRPVIDVTPSPGARAAGATRRNQSRRDVTASRRASVTPDDDGDDDAGAPTLANLPRSRAVGYRPDRGRPHASTARRGCWSPGSRSSTTARSGRARSPSSRRSGPGASAWRRSRSGSSTGSWRATSTRRGARSPRSSTPTRTGLAFVPNATTGVSTVLASRPLPAGRRAARQRPRVQRDAQRAAGRRGARRRDGSSSSGSRSPSTTRRRSSRRTSRRSRRGRGFALVSHVTSPTALVLPVARDRARAGPAGRGHAGRRRRTPRAWCPWTSTRWAPRTGPATRTSGCARRRDRRSSTCGPTCGRRIRPLVVSHGANDDRTRPLAVPAPVRLDRHDRPDPVARAPGGDPLRGRHARRRLGGADGRRTPRWPGRARDAICAALGVPAPAPDAMLGSMAAVPLPGHRPDARPRPSGSRRRCSTRTGSRSRSSRSRCRAALAAGAARAAAGPRSRRRPTTARTSTPAGCADDAPRGCAPVAQGLP